MAVILVKRTVQVYHAKLQCSVCGRKTEINTRQATEKDALCFLSCAQNANHWRVIKDEVVCPSCRILRGNP